MCEIFENHNLTIIRLQIIILHIAGLYFIYFNEFTKSFSINIFQIYEKSFNKYNYYILLDI